MYWKWTYGQNIISIEEKDLRVVIQDNLSPKKHLDKIFGSMMSKNIKMAFHILDKDMMRKIITKMIRPKLQYAGVK